MVVTGMSGMYDLHTHSILSDGEMLPIELIRRMAVIGIHNRSDHRSCGYIQCALLSLPPLPECVNRHISSA